MILILALTAVLAGFSACLAADAAPAAETPAERDARMKWFRDARFGMFIHWGVYSVPAGEWKGNKGYGEWFLEETKMPVSEYEKFARQFNPVKFDAKQWVGIAKGAGVKYIVITSKHHDGFGMYRSDLTDWCIKSTPFQRDPLKELAAACKEAGITFCLYHSIMDWHHPDWGQRRKWNDKVPSTPPNMDRYAEYMKGQLKELVSGYGPLGILWFDGEWEAPWTHDRGVDLYHYVRSLQPSIIVNNRVGKSRAGMSGMDQGKDRAGDYGTPEQEIPATGFGPGVDWESCMTMNDHWGYNKADQNWKSTQVMIHNLIDCASKGGNYLLNVGPTSEGLIPGPSVERMAEIGHWMKVNGESIHGTTASPFRKLPWGRCTKKVDGDVTTLFFHVFNWPADGKLMVPGVRNPAEGAHLLADADRKSLAARSAEEGLTITVPTAAPNAISSTVVVKVKGDLKIEQMPLMQAADGTLKLLAADAITHGDQIKSEGGQGQENIGYWISSADWIDWEFKITKPGKFKVSAELASTGTNSFELIVGDKKLTGKAPKTGDYKKYQTLDLGTIEIPTSGKTSLAIKAVKEGWQPMNVKWVLLKLE
jgi:alpha-L-fucosidase